MGSRLLLRTKSSRSSTVLSGPSGIKPLHRLKPSTQGMDRMVISTMFTSTAFLMVQPVRSVAKEMMFWNTAITVENAAKDINMKNSVPQSLPPTMWLNTLGSVIKIRDGPAWGSML